MHYSHKNRITGYTHSKAWNDRTIYYAIVFNRPCNVTGNLPQRDSAEKYFRDLLDFGDSMEPVMIKVSISVNSIEDAYNNIKSELPGWDFEAVRKEAKDTWNEHLGRIEATGTKEQKRIFYTAMYHLMMHPNNIADAGQEPFYSTLSLWDTFRAAHPLFTIIAPASITISFLGIPYLSASS